MRFILSILIGLGARWAHADVDSEFARVSLRHGMAVAARMLERFPPRTYGYILAGRSPAVISAYLDEMSRRAPRAGVRKIDLPISGLGGWAFNASTYDRFLHGHFDRFIPAADERARRRWVVLDFAATGSSFHRLADYFGRYAKARNIPGEFEALMLRVSPTIPVLQAPPIELPEMVTQSSGLAVHQIELDLDEWLVFQMSRFKAYAPYGEFSFRSDRADLAPSVLERRGESPMPPRLEDHPAPEPNPAYAELRRAVREILDADQCERDLSVPTDSPWWTRANAAPGGVPLEIRN